MTVQFSLLICFYDQVSVESLQQLSDALRIALFTLDHSNETDREAKRALCIPSLDIYAYIISIDITPHLSHVIVDLGSSFKIS